MKRQPIRQAVCYMTINKTDKYWEALCPLVSDTPLMIDNEEFKTIDRAVPRARKTFQAFLESMQTVLWLGCTSLLTSREDELRNPEDSEKHSFEAMKAKYGAQELYPINYDILL